MNLIEKYKNELEEIRESKHVNTILIFGSYSINKIKPTSDLDIAIIFKENTPIKNKHQILSMGNEELDLNDFQNLPLSLQFKIINTSNIYSNKIDLYPIKREIRDEWFDFKPILNRIYKSKNLLPII